MGSVGKLSVLVGFLAAPVLNVHCWTPAASAARRISGGSTQTSTSGLWTGASASPTVTAASSTETENQEQHQLFDDFVVFLLDKQTEIVQQLEDLEKEHGSAAVFSKDTWGMFEDGEELANAVDSECNDDKVPTKPVGGITRVIQGGNVIEKGACSFTLIGQGILSKERAATIRARQGASKDESVEGMIQGGDEYAAAALSMVLHSRSPHVPTFRSDVRVFLVRPKPRQGENDRSSPPTIAWFGGGADLTPYYINEQDIKAFHTDYFDLCQRHWDWDSEFTYFSMKKACDDYFYLPARQEHRGTGGIFFDAMDMTRNSLKFVEGVANTWMHSWIPIAKHRHDQPISEQQRHWQLLRRGRYLEFNLLYDRGVRFGLANANPRVEGVMVSAPPMIAFDYNHEITPDSPEAQLMGVLRQPKDWV